MEERLRTSDSVSVLDHGYLRVVDGWGSDQAVVEAARMSTQKGFLGWGPRCVACKATTRLNDVQCPRCGEVVSEPGDEKLLRYLYENKHATPFEFGGLVIEVQAPIWVFREWHRHRTQSYNEMSARYEPLPDLNYVPTVKRLVTGSRVAADTKNKQAKGAKNAPVLTEAAAADVRAALVKSYDEAERLYQLFLAMGVPNEVARNHLPVGRYSRMRAQANLRNWLAFITLRSSPKAAWEIRQYSDALGVLLADRFPRTWDLFAAGAK